MFSATLSSEIRPVCKKFMRDVRRTGAPGRRRAARRTQPRFTRPAHRARAQLTEPPQPAWPAELPTRAAGARAPAATSRRAGSTGFIYCTA